MKQITDVLRLKFEVGLSHEKNARALGLSKGAVAKYASLALQMLICKLTSGFNAVLPSAVVLQRSL